MANRALQDAFRAKYRRNNPRPSYDPEAERQAAEARNNARTDWSRRTIVEGMRALGVPEFTTDNIVSAAEYLPGIGDALGAQDALDAGAEAYSNPTLGNLGSAGLMGAAAMLGIVPGAGDAASKALKRLAGNAGEASAKRGIRAYHGSPHDFDQFSLDKIGTGEGAQAYGHGLYFAENEGVAKSYRDQLAGDVSTIGDLAVNTTRRPDEAVSAWMSKSKDLPDEIRRAVAEKLNNRLGAREILDDLSVDFYGQYNDDVAKILKSSPGHMYEVNINADPKNFLDWDKPLSEQPKKVQEFAQARAQELFGREFDPRLDGQAIARFASPQHGVDGTEWLDLPGGVGEAAARKLRAAGIPGIRYFDQGSRAAGEGSRNYVVFDDKLVSIVRKYGIAGAAAVLGVSAADIEAAMSSGGEADPQL